MELSLGLTKALLGKMTEQDKFSSYLPYVAYDPGTRTYHNADGSRGLIWECTPLWFAGEATAKTLTGLFRSGIPDGSVMQFIP
ncbi:MAG: TraC family protein, partial [Deltaproteobacteria bacterium]|nr:TraC family protein [Deltaproteobacteria bacterium]